MKSPTQHLRKPESKSSVVIHRKVLTESVANNWGDEDEICGPSSRTKIQNILSRACQLVSEDETKGVGMLKSITRFKPELKIDVNHQAPPETYEFKVICRSKIKIQSLSTYSHAD